MLSTMPNEHLPLHSGLLNLKKPAGLTSRQVVDRIQRLARPLKVGHAGTLDPLATGVLVVCVGAATRLIEYVQRMPKTYTGAFLLGRHSPTEDVEGEVTELPEAPVPSLEQIAAAAARFLGQIEQRPPAYSALKVNGRRAYDLARKGQPVELAPRAVYIHRIEIKEYDYPRLTLDVQCGGGTYIRSLGRDLATSLGTAAVMAELQRTAIGRFEISQAVDPDAVTAENISSFMLPPRTAIECLPQVVLTAEQAARVRGGLFIDKMPLAADAVGSEAGEIAALDEAGRLLAILAPRGPDKLGPLRNFPIE
jgi:tRNA pseudouridine55 synthase